MSIHMTAEYRVRPDAVDQVTAAIRKFVSAISTTEPGTRLYAAWQDERDPVHFFHHFVFDDEAGGAIAPLVERGQGVHDAALSADRERRALHALSRARGAPSRGGAA
jgi:hypothetical protein